MRNRGILQRGALALGLVLLVALLAIPHAEAFCGFYVAQADTKLFNKASKVVMVRDGERTVLTMANDYQGVVEEFAIVVPVPTVLEREQIHVANNALIEHIDAFTAPRLVEYFDENPCAQYDRRSFGEGMVSDGASAPSKSAQRLGVTIEAEYTIGEYDILILSAKESAGLETWLRSNKYRIPEGGAAILGSYIGQNMKFFVAKVNLKQQKKLGYNFLRPLQIAFNSPKFMLPIRLGMLNADGPQDLFVFALTRSGRVETTNYRTVKLPEGEELPELAKSRFADFYKDMFSKRVEQENRKAVFLEHAWSTGGCDPCSSEPLSVDEMRELGAFWLEPQKNERRNPWQPDTVLPFVTRLHLRYDNEHFPEDLTFQVTNNTELFQSRYIIRHPWTGSESCSAADSYRAELPKRQQREVATLARLTGWDEKGLRKDVGLSEGSAGSDADKWWKGLW